MGFVFPSRRPYIIIDDMARGMKRKAVGLAAPLLLAAAAAAHGQVSDSTHKKVYETSAPSVCAIRAKATLGERSGTGVVLTADGLILTSYAVCPQGAENIRVWTRGPRKYTAELLATSRRYELSLLRIKPKGKLIPIRFGASSAVRVGDLSYTIGNAANSIILDDQPSLNVGVVSAMYRLTEERANSTYVGPVIETTAAVNVKMEGAPCLDTEGRMIGFITLNYSPNRFLGTAIPIDDIKHIIDRLRKQAEAVAKEAAAEAGQGVLGMLTRVVDGKVVVQKVVPDGPADRAGFQKGDVILQVADTRVTSPGDIDRRLKGLEAGSIVWITADFGGVKNKVKITLEEGK